jgi:hypothetical protein
MAAKGSDTCYGDSNDHYVYFPLNANNGVGAGVEHDDDGAFGENETVVCYSTTAPGSAATDYSGGGMKVYFYNDKPLWGGLQCFSNPLAIISVACGTNVWGVSPDVGPNGVGFSAFTGGTTVPVTGSSAFVPAPAPSTTPGTVGASQSMPCAAVDPNGTPLCGTPLVSVKVAPGDVTPAAPVVGVPSGVRLGNDPANATVAVTVAGTPASVDTTQVVPQGTCVGVC